MSENPKQNYFSKAVKWVEKKSISSMRAKADGYDEPKSFLNKRTQESVQPDLSFTTKSGAKHYTDIALKSEQKQKLVTRWKLLSLMASMNSGKLHLLAPRGHKMFTKRLVDQYNINARVSSL